jgi:predicted metal-dependent hydrolase
MDVLQEVGEFVRGKRGDLSIVRRYVQENRHRLSEARPQVRCRTRGAHHDLSLIYDAINAEYFSGKVACHITWGARSPRRRARRRTLGSFSRATNTITISPMLDRRQVPRYVVEFVVYHEMLHAFLGVEEQDGRRSVHSREFRRREKLFREHERAVAWERAHPL